MVTGPPTGRGRSAAVANPGVAIQARRVPNNAPVRLVALGMRAAGRWGVPGESWIFTTSHEEASAEKGDRI